MEKSKAIFNNPIQQRDYQKAVKTKRKYLAKFGDDTTTIYPLYAENNQVLYPMLGVKNIVTSKQQETIQPEKSIIIGNIRMGFGHYRIAIAIASAAHSMGITPYWFDLHAYQETTGGKIIKHLNQLYSMGSRWSQKYPLFNKFYWEPLNSEGFRQLRYNAADQKVAECMTPVFNQLPKDMPFVATHVWPSQAAIHAGVKRVINVIPDNWPMALHLSEGAIHTVQTPSSYLGYKMLRGMNNDQILHPMPEDSIIDVGHYVDHELLVNLEVDCANRIDRIQNNKTKRILLTVGGAGAQKAIFAQIINFLMPKIEKNEVCLLINVGDHFNVWEELCRDIPTLKSKANLHFDHWNDTVDVIQSFETQNHNGIHVFYHKDIFAAVYSTNLLMRFSDILITKPSELAFYPVPKLMIKRIGGHEAWGAIRAQEIGDGTYECETIDSIIQMLEQMLVAKTLLLNMNHNILKAYKAGIYHGAYKVVALALNQSIEK